MKSISKLAHYLLRKRHPIIKNQILFKSQKQLADFAVAVDKCRFYGKEPKGIRPFISQQLQPYGVKSIKNHFETYLAIVKAKFIELNPNIQQNEMDILLRDFTDFFSQELLSSSVTFKLTMFEEISSNTLEQLRIVAVANGGTLTEKEFLKALNNLTNLKSS